MTQIKRAYTKRDSPYSYAEKIALLVIAFTSGQEIHPTRFAETIDTDRQFVHRAMRQLMQVLPIVLVARGKWMLLDYAEERYGDEWAQEDQ